MIKKLIKLSHREFMKFCSSQPLCRECPLREIMVELGDCYPSVVKTSSKFRDIEVEIDGKEKV